MPEIRIPQGIVDALPHVRAAAAALPLAGDLVVRDISYARSGGQPVPVVRAASGPDRKGRLWVIGQHEASGLVVEPSMHDQAALQRSELDDITLAARVAWAFVARYASVERHGGRVDVGEYRAAVELEVEAAGFTAQATAPSAELAKTRLRDRVLDVLRDGTPAS